MMIKSERVPRRATWTKPELSSSVRTHGSQQSRKHTSNPPNPTAPSTTTTTTIIKFGRPLKADTLSARKHINWQRRLFVLVCFQVPCVWAISSGWWFCVERIRRRMGRSDLTNTSIYLSVSLKGEHLKSACFFPCFFSFGAHTQQSF